VIRSFTISARTGKRGRLCKRGAKLSLDDFDCRYSKGKFKIGHRCVKTKILGDITVYAYVTVSESGARRLFICTAESFEIMTDCTSHSDDSNHCRQYGQGISAFEPVQHPLEHRGGLLRTQNVLVFGTLHATPQMWH